jgi:hypothetical protein
LAIFSERRLGYDYGAVKRQTERIVKPDFRSTICLVERRANWRDNKFLNRA